MGLLVWLFGLFRLFSLGLGRLTRIRGSVKSCHAVSRSGRIAQVQVVTVDQVDVAFFGWNQRVRDIAEHAIPRRKLSLIEHQPFLDRAEVVQRVKAFDFELPGFHVAQRDQGLGKRALDNEQATTGRVVTVGVSLLQVLARQTVQHVHIDVIVLLEGSRSRGRHSRDHLFLRWRHSLTRSLRFVVQNVLLYLHPHANLLWRLAASEVLLHTSQLGHVTGSLGQNQ